MNYSFVRLYSTQYSDSWSPLRRMRPLRYGISKLASTSAVSKDTQTLCRMWHSMRKANSWVCPWHHTQMATTGVLKLHFIYSLLQRWSFNQIVGFPTELRVCKNHAWSRSQCVLGGLCARRRLCAIRIPRSHYKNVGSGHRVSIPSPFIHWSLLNLCIYH